MQDFNRKSYSTSSKIKFFIKEKMAIIIVIIGSIIFIFQDAIDWDFNDANIFVLLGSMIITYIFNLIMNLICARIGRKKAKESELFKGTMSYYAQAKKDVEDIRNYLPVYCDYKTLKEKRRIQKEILDDENLQLNKLDLYVEEKLTEEQWNAVVKAR